ncbi:LeuA family protein [Methermicoccus shengliensis]|uniref:Isopropylmalate synthase n=1 Tax=Methermicoccus shengliensis TaxID=660064 RepID=A0A832VXZ3_9EURY|nr:isopropylmalate synthase [Methermicoccus shengliensis]KUK04302.1 MAG: Pyruvate carboxyltransferase [Euryarchaeota archaeon 55_53]KUK30645.1 MAG: Pyruvate carboxyltransferase [Methanosarcinales archeaon 56_1174]MDI3488194.1 citrate (Re)-synthase [Methanosarcinales archaeon]MDN5295469.1 citrate (Re)-synthase [Methanosarcinales archaeon]HIH70233.1 isopropylmalate synthase [Methermicoccus shengliensis]
MYSRYEDIPKLSLPEGQEVYVSDSTIRDGMQMPGIVMTTEHKLRIYRALHEIGVEKLELFAYHERDRMAIREMQDLGYEKPEITGWARANPADIDIILGVDGIEETGILMSVSDVHIKTKMGLSNRQEAEEKYLSALQYAVDHGLRTRAHLEDMTRADNSGFVFPLVRKIVEIDPECIIRVCDTVGYGVPFEWVGEPYGIPYLIRGVREAGARHVETHCHDDFGMAFINSVVGYWYGADWSSVTFLGMGERAGNAELEKLLLFLNQRLGIDKYNLKPLNPLARYVQRELGIRIPRNKAVVGENIFAHESGIHTAGVLKNPFNYEPYPPEVLGVERKLFVGSTSGADVIAHKVEEILQKELGVSIKVNKRDKRIEAITREIQRLYNEEKRRSCISDDEMKEYVKKYYLVEALIHEDGGEDDQSGTFE